MTAKIAAVRGLAEGEPAVSPPTFKDLASVEDFRRFGDRVREISGGIPVGFKLSANHVERDVQFALDAGADYIILDGRGGGTGAAPVIFRLSGSGARLWQSSPCGRAGKLPIRWSLLCWQPRSHPR